MENAAELALSSVRSRSAELSIPFSNLASAFMLEEALSVIAGSCYSDHFILRNRSELSLSAYRTRVVHELSFYYNGSFALRDLATVVTRTLVREKNSGINWDMGLRMTEEGTARLLMKGELPGMKVPFEIILTPAPERCVEKTEEFRFFFYPDRRFPCIVYPKEQILVEALTEIIRKMELITELKPYDTVYTILSTETLDGRHVRETLSAALFDTQLTIDQKRLNMLLNYRDYSYMKKKWKTYLRGVKKEGPDFGTVIDLLGSFLTPLWDSISKDTVFFGDWMPDLKRFLL